MNKLTINRGTIKEFGSKYSNKVYLIAFLGEGDPQLSGNHPTSTKSGITNNSDVQSVSSGAWR